MESDPFITIVVPFLDEEGSLEELYARLTSVLSSVGQPYEILFVDDGSRDRGPAIVDDLAARDPHVGVVHFRRNFGKAAALDAGFRRARGRIVFTMDADLQDDPNEIPNFLAKLSEGYDLVSGWKKKRHDPLGKTLPSKFFNFVVSRSSGLRLNDFNCGFKAYRTDTVRGLDLYGELHRYVPVLVHWRGFRVTEIPVVHHPRTTGASKYGIERMAKGFFDLLTVLLITRYRARPLHLFGGVGLAFAFVGFVCLAYLSIIWFMGHNIGNRPLLLLGVLLMLVGVQLVSTGLLGEMISSTQAGEKAHYEVRSERLAESPGAPIVLPVEKPRQPALTA
ncbi:MAG TPA: glycosyltransferase family 2 protein [Polyangiaceae bacterium]|nr:glycosyltransferase family 2 protein [Polyangiaceae bacterium]